MRNQHPDHTTFPIGIITLFIFCLFTTMFACGPAQEGDTSNSDSNRNFSSNVHRQYKAKTLQGDVFRADTSCELFESKNKKTNPGRLKTAAGKTYVIKETLKKDGQNAWFRVQTDAARSPLRWVAAGCGVVKTVARDPDANSPEYHEHTEDRSKNACMVAGRQDSQILALSWQPGFCKTKPGKTECKNLHNEPYAATHFSLHGLWPNLKQCGISYGYCGRVRKKPRNFCDYPPVKSLTSSVRKRLEKVMLSVKYGTCLQRHEYWKHGACAYKSGDEYYRVALAVLTKVNNSSFVQEFISANIGQDVSQSAFKKAFERAFGQGTGRHIQVACQGKMLKEIFIKLPGRISPDASLTSLLKSAGVYQGSGRCQNKIYIPEVSK